MIIVTGGTGLLGSHLLLRLAGNNKPVRVLVRESSKPEQILETWKYYIPDPYEIFRKIEWQIIDPLNKASLMESIQDAQQIFHCAANVSFNPRKKKEIWNANVTFTSNLVDCSLELKSIRLIHVSSTAAIGKPQNEELADETSGWPIKPASIYAKTKTLGELEVWRGINEGLKAVIVNPSVILGPVTGRQGSAAIFETLRKGIKFYPSGTTGLVDVRDVAEILVQLADSDISGERFILNNANMSYRELFHKIALGFGNEPPKYLLSHRMTSIAWKLEWLLSLLTGNEPRITKQTSQAAQSIQKYSSEKISRHLGFSFRNIDETIKTTVKFYSRK